MDLYSSCCYCPRGK